MAGYKILLGNQAWLESQQVAVERLAEHADLFARQGQTPVYMAVDGKEAAVFAIADSLARRLRRRSSACIVWASKP
nr:hypothetical protein [Methylomonas koyamae]